MVIEAKRGMNKEQEQQVIKDHSDFLLTKVIVPTFAAAFEMGWNHGAKHALEAEECDSTPAMIHNFYEEYLRKKEVEDNRTGDF